MTFNPDNNDNIQLDDAALVRRCQRGDPEAMTCLIVKYQDRVYNTILKICQNRDDAAELTQDTFVKVLENINKFRGQSGFYTWLFRVAVNLTLAALLADPDGADPAKIAQQKELAQIIVNLIGQLSQEHRVVLVLRDIEQMSYADIADVLRIEHGTVKSRISRARRMLRELLETVLT